MKYVLDSNHGLYSRLGRCLCLLLLGFVFSGCATVIKGSRQTVEITSNPSNANVYVNNKAIGITPTSKSFRHGKKYTVEVRKNGYRPGMAPITSSLSGHAFWLGGLSLVFDAASGNISTIDQKKLHFNLREDPNSARPPRNVANQRDQWSPSAGGAWSQTPKVSAKPSAPKAANLKTDLKVAVLEFRNLAKLSNFAIESITDMVRGSALSLGSGRLFVLTRENIRQMLPPDTRLSDCKGRCEIETGRNIGADFIVTGSVGKFGSRIQVKMKLHNTKSGRLLGTKVVSAKSIEVLEEKIKKNGQDMFREAIQSISNS